MIEPVRVLFVDHAEVMGGAEYSLVHLLTHIDRDKVQPFLACSQGDLSDAVALLNVGILPVSLPQLRGRVLGPLRLVRGSRALVRLIHQHRIDIIHSNTMRAGLYASLSAAWSKRPMIWHARDIHDRRERWYTRWMCRSATRVVSVSHAVAASLPCPGKITVVHNGLNLEEYSAMSEPTDLREELSLDIEAPIVGIVGRLRPWKGHELFLQAAAIVSRSVPEARFLVVGGTIFPGESGYEAAIHRLAKTMGLGDKVIFTGHRSDVPRAMATLDVLVHCARSEPFGRVLIEAMASGRPVVAVLDGAAAEIVEDKRTGLLVPAGDETALAQAIVSLIRDPARRRSYGEAGRQRVEDCFDARNVARAVEKLYQSLC